MDTKIEFKEEDPLSHDVVSQNEKRLFTKNVTLITNSDAVLLDDDCDMAVKTKIKLETPFPDFCLQKEREFFTKHLVKQIKCEMVTCSNNCGIGVKTRICSQKEGEFLPENPVIKANKCNSDHKVDYKIEIKEEPWWMETETSSVCDGMKDRDFTPVKSPRVYTEAASGHSSEDSQLPSAEASEKSSSFFYEKDGPECESQENYVTKTPPVEKYVHTEQSSKCSDGKIYSSALLTHKSESSAMCKTCGKSFTQLSYLKLHNLIHEGKKPHKCEICEKRFTLLSHLKSHNLIHEDKRLHECEICKKRFNLLSYLKKHNLMHEGKRRHKCEICEKRFTQLSYLKRHNLIHEGKMPHKCEICEKRFTRLSDLKRHNLICKCKKPHKCKIRDMSFTRLSSLKSHSLIHESKNPNS